MANPPIDPVVGLEAKDAYLISSRDMDILRQALHLKQRNERLQAERDKLREALTKIAEHGVSSHAWAWCNKIAREALEGK